MDLSSNKSAWFNASSLVGVFKASVILFMVFLNSLVSFLFIFSLYVGEENQHVFHSLVSVEPISINYNNFLLSCFIYMFQFYCQ